MRITRKQIYRWFSDSDYQKGVRYFNDQKVHTISYSEKDNEIAYQASVDGSMEEPYFVSLILRPRQLQGSCTCPWFSTNHACKHLVASLLMVADGDAADRQPKKTVSDRYASRVLFSYQQRVTALPAPKPAQLAHVQPRISVLEYGRDYPAISLMVGYDKLYVVRNVHEFLMAFEEKREVSYGKGLTLRHALEEFDPESQQLIELLANEFDDLSTFDSYSGYYSSSYSHRIKTSEIILTGRSFDQFFRLYCGQRLPSQRSKADHILKKEDPKVTLHLERKSDYAELSIPELENLHFFGYSRALYAVTDNAVLRCSREFQEQAFPMLKHSASPMTMALDDMAAFCSVVVPEIRKFVTIEDESDLLHSYLPDECVSCFYFDWEDDHLTGWLKFRYGEKEIPENTSVSVGIRRDIRSEQVAHQLMTQFLLYRESQKRYVLFDEEEIYDFLTDSISQLQSVGEVYLSERLQNKQVRPAPSTVGVSVSNGMLSLDIDTGEFPPAELEALYNSLLHRRKYHRLKDGRFLTLDGSSYETLAEMAHMTQLTPKELESGHVDLPLYRGLYLDSVLKQDEGLTINRDSQFRSMVRSFKTVSDSDYVVPESMRSILRPYQKTGFRWLKTLESSGFGGILADEMGLGKTIQVIAFLQTASRAVTGLPSLIVCPASLVLNWADECAKFGSDLGVTLIMGTAKERRALLKEHMDSTDLFVTSYDLLKRDIDLYTEHSFYCCVLDEGQYIKNQSTLASKAVKRINARQRFVLTGTPIENRLSELWNLFDFLMPGYLFAHSRFVEKLEKPIVRSGDEAAGQQLSKMVQPFLLRRLKKDVLKELPPKVEHVRKVQMADNERKTYLASVAAAKQDVLMENSGKLQILAALTRLRQICCDPHLCFENYEGEASKLDACVELCSGMTENGHQILLFSQFTSMLDRIRKRLDEENITTFTLQGSTPKEKRAELVRRFNNGEAQVFLISLKAGGTGLNLTAADVVIHYDPWWNIAAQNQATDRAHRIGQRACVQVYKLIAKDSIEEKILDLQEQKAALMEAVSGDGESIMSMSQEDLLALLE